MRISSSLWILLAAPVASLALITGCAGGPEPSQRPDPPITSADASVGGWPDMGATFPDFGIVTSDAGATGGSDGATRDSGSCAASSASCSSCSADQLCTSASSGSCVDRVSLSSSSSGDGALRAAAIAFAKCWESKPGKNKLCAAFDTCGLADGIKQSALSSWVCRASVLDFPTNKLHDAAKSIFACWTGHLYRPRWNVQTIDAKQKGKTCLSYAHFSIGIDVLVLDSCSKYKP